MNPDLPLDAIYIVLALATTFLFVCAVLLWAIYSSLAKVKQVIMSYQAPERPRDLNGRPLKERK